MIQTIYKLDLDKVGVVLEHKSCFISICLILVTFPKQQKRKERLDLVLELLQQQIRMKVRFIYKEYAKLWLNTGLGDRYRLSIKA